MVERVSSSLLHAIANPMNVILGRAGMLEMMRPDDAELSRALGEIRRQIEKASSIATQLQEFVSAQEVADESRSLAGELEIVLGALAVGAKARGVRVDVAPLDPVLRAPARGKHVYDMLYGVLGFAIETSPRGSVLHLELTRVDVPPPRSAACVLMTLGLPLACEIPENKREIVAPWLCGAVPIPEARLLLAVGIGAAQARDGWHEIQAKDGARMLRVYLPLRPVS